jgi:1,4-alpha-glucan branching enzyme
MARRDHGTPKAVWMQTDVHLTQLGQLLDGDLDRPGTLLGPHRTTAGGRPARAVRAFLPDAAQAWVLDGPERIARPMRRLHPQGLFEAICPDDSSVSSSDYQLRVAKRTGEVVITQDPFAVPSSLTDFDRYLFSEGRHYDLHRKLGAQMRTIDGLLGVNFAVWAPNARVVQLVGDFNQWDGRQSPMQRLDGTGLWELFVPHGKPGDNYKFRIRTAHGEWVDKCDPFGFAAELPPRTASVVANLDEYVWGDEAWMHQRRTTNTLDKPINVYEVHLGSWQKDWSRHHGWMNYRDLAHQLVDYCLKMNFTHLELLPVSEHPFTGSWGYQTVGYYAATSRYGSPQDLMYLVDHCHRNGIGVILDWVPAHFPRDGHGLRAFDGSALYEHADPRQGEHPDWGTMIFNYGRTEVRNFLIANALFWMDRYHIDGLRVDAVASMLYLDYSRKEGEWIPNRYGGRENLEAIDFLREFNREAHARYPGVLTIAEESTAWGGVSRPVDVGGLGFSLKWNMGWMNDTLRYFRHEAVHRSWHHDELTFSLIYAFTENFNLPLSHDEVVHGKGALLSQMPGDLWQKFANLRLLYSYMWTHPGKKLLFMGGEFGQWNEWNHDVNLQWELLDFDTHRGIQNLVRDLNGLVVREPALHRHDFSGEGFEWIDCMNRHDSVLVYIRKAEGISSPILVCSNFTPVVRHGYRIGVPHPGYYREVLNSDAAIYGGSNIGNYPGIQAEPIPHHGRPYSINIAMPPLGTVIFRLD